MAKTKAVRQEQARFRTIRSFYEKHLDDFVAQLPGGSVFPNPNKPWNYEGRLPFHTLQATENYIRRRQEAKLELVPNCYIAGEESWGAYELLEYILRSPAALSNFLESFVTEAGKYELRIEFRDFKFKVKPGLISQALADTAFDKLNLNKTGTSE